METKTKKTTMIGAALAVAIVAMAGAGYALTYTATTSNTGNNLAATYIELSQGGTAAYSVSSFLTSVYFNTDDTATVGENSAITHSYTYTMVYDHVYNAASTPKTYTPNETASANMALAGEGITLSANNVGAAPGTVVLDIVPSSGFNYDPGLTYTMVIGTKDDSTKVVSVTDQCNYNDTTRKWSFTGLTLAENATATWNLFLFISGSTTVAPSTGFASSNVVFDFTLTATPATS